MRAGSACARSAANVAGMKRSSKRRPHSQRGDAKKRGRSDTLEFLPGTSPSGGAALPEGSSDRRGVSCARLKGFARRSGGRRINLRPRGGRAAKRSRVRRPEGGLGVRFAVVACPRCGGRRVVEEGRKTAQCPRCANRIDLARARPQFTADSVEEARAFIGESASRAAGSLKGFREDVRARTRGRLSAHDRELRKIAEASLAATNRANRLRAILRRSFEAFGELTVEDLEKIATYSGLGESGEDLAQDVVDLGLAGRGERGELLPLREGR